jgi:endo-1,4-beta-xylanase
VLTRRALLPAALAAAAAWRGHAVPAALAQAGTPAPAGGEPLKVRAARRGLFYGCAVSRRALETDPAYAAAVVREAASLTPEWEMKWGTVEKRRGEPRYDEADAIAGLRRAPRAGAARHTPGLVPQHAPLGPRGDPGR